MKKLSGVFVDERDEKKNVSWTARHYIKDKSEARRWDNQNAAGSKGVAIAPPAYVQGSKFSGVPVDEREKELLKITNWDHNPKKVKSLIGARFPNGPMLNREEVSAIESLSETDFGQEWLHAAGLFTYQEAQDYIDQGNYLDFQLLHKASKMLLAYVAWYEKYDQAKGTPPFWIARSILSENEELSHLKTDINNDLMKVWAQTLKSPLNRDAKAAIKQGAVPDPTGRRSKPLNVEEVRERHAHATEVLHKVLVILQAGLEISVDKKGTLRDYFEGPVVKALSHGGRVNIRIPKLRPDDRVGAYALPDWLGITKNQQPAGEKGVFSRPFSTHYVAIGKDKADGSRGTFKEKGQQLATIQGKLDRHEHWYGMNLAVGGIGQKDFNGDVILPDGAHGHMFIGFEEPTNEKDGALQIGIETTAPHAPSTVGYIHNMFSSEKTANPISSAGGLKKDKVGEGKDNARTVDLARLGDNWLEELKEFQRIFQFETNGDIEKLVGQRQSVYI